MTAESRSIDTCNGAATRMVAPLWMRRVLLFAAVYNVAWGAFAIFSPMTIFRWTGFEPLPAYPELWQCIGMIVGVYGALYFSDFAAGYISRWFDWSEQTVNLAAFAVTFVGIVYLIATAGKLLTKVADMAFLGSINKILGGVFQALTVGFILSIVIMGRQNDHIYILRGCDSS